MLEGPEVYRCLKSEQVLQYARSKSKAEIRHVYEAEGNTLHAE